MHPGLARVAVLVSLLAIAAAEGGCGSSPPTSSAPSSTVRSASSAKKSIATRRGTRAPVKAKAARPAGPSSLAPASPATARPPRPPIVSRPISFGAKRKAEMVAYATRHYGLRTYRLVHPHVIVIHYTETPSFQSTYNTFAPDVPDSELHELPGTCAHFVLDSSGGIHQLVSLGVMCRHTVRLNWTAIGVEHVGFSDQQVLADRAQMAASLKLVRWLRCRYHIALSDVIGHNESLSSPYHREDVPALRTQTHADFKHADMRIYRHRLASDRPC